MQKRLTAELLSSLLIAISLVMTSCIKDNCKGRMTYTYYVPVYKTKTEVKANIRSNTPRDIEKPGKIYILGQYIFLNEIDKGIHVINNANPSQPQQISFIDIPGNMDLAVKGNSLYADMYADLVTIDITDPRNVKLGKVIEGIFPERNWGGGFVINGSDSMVVSWIEKETTVTQACDGRSRMLDNSGGVFFLSSQANTAASVSPVGVGGSMARFTIVNDYMYTVDRHSLRSVSISNPSDPVLKNQLYAGWDIETIYPFKNSLFVGSMGGMFIFDITNPETPVSKSSFIHARACDPVVADDNYAYVTLRSGSNCGPANNELQIIDVKDLQSPALVKTYGMNGPQGLAIDNDLLFICDGNAGLKTYNAANVQELKLLHTITGIAPHDVIAMNRIALVIAADGLYQYDYSNPSAIRLLSRITVKK